MMELVADVVAKVAFADVLMLDGADLESSVDGGNIAFGWLRGSKKVV